MAKFSLHNLNVDNRPFIFKYGLALSSCIYILFPTLYQSNLLWNVSPFLILIPSVLLSAWYGGLLPGLFATFVGMMIGDYFFTRPYYTLYITNIDDITRFILFAIVGILVSILSQMLHNALRNAKKEAEEQKRIAILLKKADQQKSTFLNVVAHELKTPLTIIRILTYRILERNKKTIEKRALQEFDSEVERLTVLVDDLLEVSRMEKNKLTLEKKKINMTTTIHQVVNRMKEITPTHTIVSDISRNFFVFADELRIKQVLINLIANAVKHSPKQTAILINIKEEKNMVVVSVEDKGVGISEKDQQYIFDMFYQVDDYFTKGFGLGLYISKEIITQHQGKIWVDSQPGEGSTFYFSLPKVLHLN